MDNEKQYHLLIKARNFHYDNFNKWMTFFMLQLGRFLLDTTALWKKQN